MPAMQLVQTTAIEWGVFVHMRGVLLSPRAVSTPKQTPGRRDAGGYQQIRGESWPGRYLGVREPDPCETPLSVAEVKHGLSEGLYA